MPKRITKGSYIKDQGGRSVYLVKKDFLKKFHRQWCRGYKRSLKQFSEVLPPTYIQNI